MRIICYISAILWLSICCWSGRLRAEDAPAAKDTTLNGTFTWAGKKHDLKVVLTRTAAANEYTALFVFLNQNDPRKEERWKGTFKRNPQNGAASGTATDGGRNFDFDCKFANGVLTGQAYATRGKDRWVTSDVAFNVEGTTF